MKPEQIFALWAPDTSTWSPWASPVVFPLLYVTTSTEVLAAESSGADRFRSEPFGKTAFVLDLPGAECITTGLALLQAGFRLVPVFTGSPAPTSFGFDPDEITSMDTKPEFRGLTGGANACVVDMTSLVQAMQQATPTLAQTVLPPDAPPAFLLDSFRLEGHRVPRPKLFDNRWMVFSQDLPSALFLRSKGIERIVLVQNGQLEPRDDLKHVLRRWQEGGLEIRAMDKQLAGASQMVDVPKPSRFRAFWHRAMAILGLRRNGAGGFGSFIPEPSSGGGFG